MSVGEGDRQRRQPHDRDPVGVEEPAERTDREGDDDRRARIGTPSVGSHATSTAARPIDRSDRQVDLAAHDDERHGQDDDRLLDAQLEEVDLVLDTEIAGNGGRVVRRRPR